MAKLVIYERSVFIRVEAVQHTGEEKNSRMIIELFDRWGRIQCLLDLIQVRGWAPCLLDLIPVGDWVVYDSELESVIVVTNEVFKRCFKEK